MMQTIKWVPIYFMTPSGAWDVDYVWARTTDVVLLCLPYPLEIA